MKCSWTCGECGDRIEVDSPVADLTVNRLRDEHKEAHRWATLTPEQQSKEVDANIRASLARYEHESKARIASRAIMVPTPPWWKRLLRRR
jgi:hypothetical protein